MKNPYGYTVDPFRGADEDWTTWAPNLKNTVPTKVKVYLETVGNKEVNEFFIPSIVKHESADAYGLQLKRNPSVTTVLENDVETTVIFEITDNFGHTHKIPALTFTIKKDANPAN